MSFHYYLYISDSKVDMLVQQIDPALARNRTSEFSVDLKILKGRRGTETTNGAGRTGRLERVVRHLMDHGDLGSVDEPGQFFWGLLPVQWGPLVGRDGLSLIYFGGRTERTVLGLGGSRSHVVGASSCTGNDPALVRSLLPSLLDGLASSPEIESLIAGEDRGFDEADRAALGAVHRATTVLRGPAQNVEFIAKRLLHGPSPHSDELMVLLGSPLYVALVD